MSRAPCSPWRSASRPPGHDPVRWLREHPGRIRAVHPRNQRGTVPTEDLLEGNLDFAEVMEALHGFGGWLTLELWHPQSMRPATSMVESTRRSAELLRRLGSEARVLFRAIDGFVTDDDGT